MSRFDVLEVSGVPTWSAGDLAGGRNISQTMPTSNVGAYYNDMPAGQFAAHGGFVVFKTRDGGTYAAFGGSNPTAITERLEVSGYTQSGQYGTNIAAGLKETGLLKKFNPDAAERIDAFVRQQVGVDPLRDNIRGMQPGFEVLASKPNSRIAMRP